MERLQKQILRIIRMRALRRKTSNPWLIDLLNMKISVCENEAEELLNGIKAKYKMEGDDHAV